MCFLININIIIATYTTNLHGLYLYYQVFMVIGQYLVVSYQMVLLTVSGHWSLESKVFQTRPQTINHN